MSAPEPGAAAGQCPAQQQPAPETPYVDALIAKLNAKINEAGAALTALRSGITGVAADLDRSAAETRPSRKSEIEDEFAAQLRQLLED